MNQKEFKYKYGRHRFEESDKRYFLFLGFSALIMFSIISYLANMDYQNLRLNAQSDIEDRYISYIVDSDYTQKDKSARVDDYFTYDEKEVAIIEAPPIPTISEMVEQMAAIETQTEVQLSRPSAAKDREIAIDRNLSLNNEALIKSKSGLFRDQSTGMANVDAGLYSIDRSAEITIKTPGYLTEEKKIWGYRNQEEILGVIYGKSLLIESCYERMARRTWVKPGYIKVQFNISPRGFVLPGSITIMESTIRNKDIEQCIKKTIRRWREFEKLADNYGIAKVVHKFIFN